MSLEPSLLVVSAELVEKLVRLARIRIGLGPFGNIDVKLSTPFTSENIDARLKKIEAARQNLSEALTAMDELKEASEQNRRDLEALTSAIARAESDKADLNAQLEALKKLSSLDTEVVREALRIPTDVDKWKERIWGFVVGGVIAGLVATAVWELAIRPHVAG
jgi:vacuolar-type H+-ATPase subunit I/STV1